MQFRPKHRRISGRASLIFLIVLLVLPVIEGSIWDPFGISKLNELFVEVAGDTMTGDLIAPFFNGSFNWSIRPGDSKRYLDFDGSSLLINESEINETVKKIIAVTYYNVTSINVNIGTDNTNDITQLQNYDGFTYNISEATGAPAMDVRINFTGVDDFNQLVIRMKTTAGGRHRYVIQIWDYTESIWEDYTNFVEVDTFKVMDLGVYDVTQHLSGGLVQVRIYLADTGIPAHETFLDWVVLSDGPATFTTNEVDPLSFHKGENINNPGYNATFDTVNAKWNYTDKLMENSSNISCSFNYDSYRWNCYFNGTITEAAADFSGEDFYNGSQVNASITEHNKSLQVEWITPSQILDVDDEDVESDLNTYVDIGGDKMTAPLSVPEMNVTGAVSCDSLDTDAFGNISCGVDAEGSGDFSDEDFYNGSQVNDSITEHNKSMKIYVDAIEGVKNGSNVNFTKTHVDTLEVYDNVVGGLNVTGGSIYTDQPYDINVGRNMRLIRSDADPFIFTNIAGDGTGGGIKVRTGAGGRHQFINSNNAELLTIESDGGVFGPLLNEGDGTGLNLYINTFDEISVDISGPRELKENIRDLEDVSWYFELHPVIFNNINGTRDRVGIISDEAALANPPLVTNKFEKIYETRVDDFGESYQKVVGYRQTDIPWTVDYKKIDMAEIIIIQNLREEVNMLRDELCNERQLWVWCNKIFSAEQCRFTQPYSWCLG